MPDDAALIEKIAQAMWDFVTTNDDEGLFWRDVRDWPGWEARVSRQRELARVALTVAKEGQS